MDVENFLLFIAYLGPLMIVNDINRIEEMFHLCIDCVKLFNISGYKLNVCWVRVVGSGD